LLKTFKGGIYLRGNKDLTKDLPIEKVALPSEVIIPLVTYGGKECEPLIKEGEQIKIGQVVSAPKEHISSYIHSSISGKVEKIGEFPHPVFKTAKGVLVRSDGSASMAYEPAKRNWTNFDKDKILSIVKQAGVVGLGGAEFPTHAKLRIQDKKPVDTFLINLIECEPYLTVDTRIAFEKLDEVLMGVELMLNILDAQQVCIAIADDKPQLIKHIREKIKNNPRVSLCVLKHKYPQGEEKQLVKAALGRIIPKGKLPCDVGVVVDNIQTVYAVYEAVVWGKPFYERVITVTGEAINKPKNLLVPLGIKLQDIIDYCGGLKLNKVQAVFGGPMMGRAQDNLDVPIIKGTSGVIFMPYEEKLDLKETDCIRCGRCLNVCPRGLMPLELNKLIKAKRWQELDKYYLSECMLCGACSFVCPAGIPLTYRMALGKKAQHNIRKAQAKKK
jgi:electron transport complex protein RnfC